MKVLFVHDGPIYRDEKGNYYGVHVNDNLRKRYLNLGDTVTFIMRVYPLDTAETSKFSLISNENLSVIEVPNFKSFRLFFKRRKFVNKLVDDAVQSHDVIMARLPSATGSLAVKYAQKHKKPLLTEVVACNWDSFWYYNWKGKLVAPYFYFKQKFMMKNIKYSIYVTKQFLQSRYPTYGKTTNCSNVELAENDNSVLEKRLLKIKSMDKQAPLVIGTVAAIDVPYKGQSDVIKAVKILKDKDFNVNYKIVGQGNPAILTELIKKLGVEKQVEILGALKHDEVFNFLDEIDLYIQPSKQEGLPRAMIEAMSRACPSMGAKTAGIPELIDEKYVFGKGDVSKISKLLQGITNAELEEQAKKNFNEAGQYKKSILNKRRLEFYKEFLEENNLSLPQNLKQNLSNA